MRITEKRAKLLNLWLLSTYANNEDCYYTLIELGVPDGVSYQELRRELSHGWYDDDIDEMIELYERTLNRYKVYGFYFSRYEHALSMEGAIYTLKEIGLWCTSIRKVKYQ